MFQAIVLYGKPQDPAEFDRYYREVHAELVKKVNGLNASLTPSALLIL